MTATIALIGNPNCGKTALFNVLTGSHQRVGNWPGVTVEYKAGRCQYLSSCVEVVDLPGTYSLSVSAHDSSIDERIACQYLLSGKAQLIVNVIDASNLERNLYLTQQLLEMQVPVVVALNMMDVVEQRGLQIDVKQLSSWLGCPVVPIIARKKKGADALVKVIKQSLQSTSRSPVPSLSLPEPIVVATLTLMQSIGSSQPEKNRHWLARRLLEGDRYAQKLLADPILKQAEQLQADISQQLGEDADLLIADARYGWVHGVAEKVVSQAKQSRYNMTSLIDKVVLNRALGIPIFLFVMYLMFLFAINVAGAFQDFFDISSSTLLVDGFAKLLNSWHTPAWLTALLANGVGKGINTTITFIPVIGGMFLFLSFLEDSGYMARAAFVMDRFMRAIGLPGKSFLPMIVGFGCNVPAVMAARTLESKRDRILTVMMMPFMSCGARLAIFAVFATAFFPHSGQNIIFLLYLLGIVVAIGTGFLLRKTIVSGEPTPMVMELPPYHLPKAGSIMRTTWFRLKHFLTRASKVIVPVCVAIGLLNTVSLSGQLLQGGDASQQSILSAVGRVATPVFEPMGLKEDNWPATVGLVTGVMAKEVVVGTLNTLYSQQGNLLAQDESQFSVKTGLLAAVHSVPDNLGKLSEAIWNPVAANEADHDMSNQVYGFMVHQFGGTAAAFSYLVFVLLYFPCVSTTAAMRREVSKAWTLFSVVWTTGIAYSVAVLTYQLMTLPQHVLSSSLWGGGILAAYLTTIYVMKKYADDVSFPEHHRHSLKVSS